LAGWLGASSPAQCSSSGAMPMRNPFSFFIDLLQQPVWIPIWVFYLMIINVGSVGFWHEPLAKLIFITFLVTAMLMMGLYSRVGFEKILGLGHLPWIPLLAYVLTKFPSVEAGFKSYLLVFSISITISLVFDIIDVWEYFKSREHI
jgi:hypothetical protein